jgi:hypothetical protein
MLLIVYELLVTDVCQKLSQRWVMGVTVLFVA